MEKRHITVEAVLYVLIFFAAVMLRLFNLDLLALGDVEAHWALQAFTHSWGSSQPGYTLLTGQLFAFAGSSNALARGIPAVIGALMVFLPIFLRKPFGKKVALVFALALALDPGMVAISRTADGRVLAVGFTLLVLAGLISRSEALAGIGLAMALLSGPSLWPGWLGITLAGGLFCWAENVRLPEIRALVQLNWKKVGLWFAGTLLVGGTWFLTSPQTLGGIGESFAAWIQGWGQPSGIGIIPMLMALVAYETLPMVMGTAGMISGLREKNPVERFLFAWWVIALVITLIYPGRQVSDLVWSLLPLWLLAARQTERWTLEVDDRWSLVVQVVITGVVGIFITMNFAGIFPAGSQIINQTHALLVVGGVLLLALITIVNAWMWSVSGALVGFRSGVLTLLAVLTVSASIQAAGLGRSPRMELWRIDSLPVEEDLLLKTTGDISEQNTGRREVLSISVINQGQPSLSWALRKQDTLYFASGLEMGADPAMVITADQQALGVEATYTGQDFAWSVQPAWGSFQLSDWIRWLELRNGPVHTQTLLLWVRSDLLPGGASQSTKITP